MNASSLFVDDGGRVVCSDHAGHYLKAALSQAPTAREHWTPLGTWERVGISDAAKFNLACETCGGAR
jgi:hypothetical protein